MLILSTARNIAQANSASYLQRNINWLIA